MISTPGRSSRIQRCPCQVLEIIIRAVKAKAKGMVSFSSKMVKVKVKECLMEMGFSWDSSRTIRMG
jgi:hypothetical protein